MNNTIYGFQHEQIIIDWKRSSDRITTFLIQNAHYFFRIFSRFWLEILTVQWWNDRLEWGNMHPLQTELMKFLPFLWNISQYHLQSSSLYLGISFMNHHWNIFRPITFIYAHELNFIFVLPMILVKNALL
jgi:hypothetical protein